MNRTVLWAAAGVLAFCALGCRSTPVPQFGPWVKEIVGSYTGPVTKGTDEVVMGRTVFTIAPDGALIGEYELLEKHTDDPGTLHSFDRVDTHTLRCRWRDKYGAGELQMVFAPDRKSFEGLWRYDGQTVRRPWNGLRH